MSAFEAEALERLARIEAGLSEHMRRTEAAEKRLDILERAMQGAMLHQAAWAGAGRALTVLGTLAGLVGAIWKMLG